MNRAGHRRSQISHIAVSDLFFAASLSLASWLLILVTIMALIRTI